jgi:hypothetical protein
MESVNLAEIEASLLAQNSMSDPADVTMARASRAASVVACAFGPRNFECPINKPAGVGLEGAPGVRDDSAE